MGTKNAKFLIAKNNNKEGSGGNMGIHKITKILNLKNLRSTQVSPNLRIPQGVQAEASFSASRIKVPGLLTSFVRRQSSKSPRLSSVSVSLLAPTLALAIAVLGISLFSQTAYAASYINVSSGSGGTISFDSIKPSSAGVSASASDTLTITTNCSAGYKVYVSGQENGDTNLTNSSASSNNTISASSTAVGSTATALSSNTWGITGDSANASANKYVGLPAYANATDAALITVPSANTSGNNTNTIYYGVKVDTTLTPGTYSGDVLYTTLVTEACNNYTVHFDANGGSGSMPDQTIPVGTATSLTMSSFARPGYMFLGWGTSSSATTPTYKDGEKVTDISGFNTTINLYALWGQSTGNMQDFKCTDLASGTTTYLTDTRDNQVYSVYRIPIDQTYKDSSTVANIAGKCLMTKDLSLGYVTGGSITKGSNLILSTDTSAGATTSSDPIYARTGVNDWSATNSNDNLQYINGPVEDYEQYSSHSYYSFGAAQKVCPRGWRLPATEEYGTNSTNASATVGLAAIVGNSTGGSKALQASPWSFAIGGYFYSSGWNSQGTYGGYWSSTQASSTDGYRLVFKSSGVYQSNTNKHNGRSVRCIAEDNYAIAYSNTGADGGEASKTSESAYESGSVTIPTVGSMTKSGYEFKGWALTSDASDATYTAEQTVTISTLISAASSVGQTTTPGSTITLYPVWESSAPPDDGNLGLMQDYGCASITPGHTATLTDSRDNQEYTIYRWLNTGTAGTDYPTGMAGYCIMTQDLSIGYVTGGSITKGSNLTLTATTSAAAATITARTGTSDWSVTNSNDNKQYIDGPQSGKEEYSSHSYYSFGAALAVCPKGWLPFTSTQRDNIITFMGGNSQAGSEKIRGVPYNFVYGGSFYSSGWSGVGSSGIYWSSTQNSGADGRYVVFNSSGLGTSYSGKNNGRSVRCVAEPTEVQDCSDTVHPTASTGCKMKDDNIWILGNSGNTVTWNNLCASSDNCDSATYCPSSDYKLPTQGVYATLVSKQGSGSQLYSALGLSSHRYFWSTTQNGSYGAYALHVDSSSAAATNGYGKTGSYHVLCYKSAS